jgi:thiol:disulfide interchange protein
MRKALALFMLLTTPALAALPAPKLSITTFQQLPVVLTQPYDEGANADAAVAAAFARAQKSHKRVMIDLGGNWCVDCIVLANFMKLPEMQRFMAAHYELVAVDVGRFNRNLQIPARYGVSKKLEGVPALLILTPDGKLVNGGDVFATASASEMTPKNVADYLAKYAE